MSDARLPTHLEATALIRQVEVAGGFGMVLQKGERDVGALIVVLTENGTNARVYERVPHVDGSRIWQCLHRQDPEKPYEFGDYLERRKHQDRDSWIIELDVANGERLIGLADPLP